MGTPDFAVASLRRLVEDGHEVVGVFTQPDKPKNRGNVLTGLEKRAQRFFRKVRRTHKNNSHSLLSPP